MNLRSFIITILLVCQNLAALGAVEYHKSVIFHSLMVRDGLPQMSVMDISQDSKGYMWFATRDGVARYDGYSFNVFRSSQESGSIAESYCTALSAGKDGKMWVGTLGGLQYFDPASSSFSPLLLTGKIKRMLMDGAGQLWVTSGNSLYRYDEQSSSMYQYSQDSNSSDKGVFEYLCRSWEDGTILTGGSKGVFALHVPSGIFSRVSAIPSDSDVRALYCDSDGIVWVGTTDGLMKLDRNLELSAFYSKVNGLSNSFVRSISEDRDGNLLLGTFDGYNVLDKASGKIRQYRMDTTRNTDALSFFSVVSLFCDRDNTVWIGSYVGGVNYYNESENAFLRFEEPSVPGSRLVGIVSPIVEDALGFWIGLEGGGLLFRDRYESSFEKITLPVDDSDFRSNIINSMSRYGRNLWIGFNNGTLMLLDTRTRKVTRTFRFPKAMAVETIYCSSDGYVYIGTTDKRTGDGLMVLDPQMNLHRGFGFRNVSSIAPGPDAKVLVASYDDGVSLFDLRSGITEHADSTFPQVKINHLTRDQWGRTWVATLRDGILMLDDSLHVKMRFDHSNGLASDNVVSLCVASDGNVWAAHQKEISCVDPRTSEIRYWSSREASEFTLRSSRSSDGLIAFGCDRGIIWINQASGFPDPVDAVPQIEELSIEGRRMSASFSCFDYISTGNIRFSVKLEPIEKRWSEQQSHNKVSYSGLRPGRYTFRVKAFNGKEDDKGMEGESVSFKVPYPVFLQWWAFIIYALVTGCVWYGSSIYRKKLRSISRTKDMLDRMYDNQARISLSQDKASAPSDSEFIEKLNGLLRSHIADPDLDIDMLCQEIGMSRTNIYYKIKKITGVAPADFIRRTRMQIAANLLDTHKYSVSQIADMVGFENHSSFTLAFRKVFDCTPSEYQANKDLNSIES